jgi:hypothetical protein
MPDDHIEMSAELRAFSWKLDVCLNGERPEWSEVERVWFRVFREVASMYDWIPRAESFELSLTALARCEKKGKSRKGGYVRLACINGHKDHIKRLIRRRIIRPEGKDETVATDTRIDFNDALNRMPPRLATVLRMRRDEHDNDSIARELGIGTRHLRTIMWTAEEQLRRLLGRYY